MIRSGAARALLLAAGAVLAGFASSGCDDDGDAPPAGGSTVEPGWHEEIVPTAEDLRLTVAPAAAEVKLGEDLVFRVRVENRGPDKLTVNLPRLGRDSVTFKVRSDSFDTAWLDPKPVKFTAQGMLPEPAEVREIGHGEAAESEIRVTAALCGRFVFAPVYVCQGLRTPLTAEPFEVKVTAPENGTHLGFRLETSQGTIDAKLRPEIAFQTSTSFATLVKSGFYDGLTFHRVVQGFVAQGGDPTGKGWGGPSFTIRHEWTGKLKHVRGTFSMARSGDPRRDRDTAGSQFFIMFAPAPLLDQLQFAAFAEMVDGEATLAAIEKLGAPSNPSDPRRGGSEAPSETITIRKASLLVLP